jgi:transcriptional regulator with XRE-family HTH domain
VTRSKVDDRTRAALKRIGAAIRRARREAGLSQARLAEAISMDRENYAKIERAEINVTVDTLVRIARGLGVRLELDFVPPRSRRPPARGD